MGHKFWERKMTKIKKIILQTTLKGYQIRFFQEGEEVCLGIRKDSELERVFSTNLKDSDTIEESKETDKEPSKKYIIIRRSEESAPRHTIGNPSVAYDAFEPGMRNILRFTYAIGNPVIQHLADGTIPTKCNDPHFGFL
jgi:hypothetical protein